MAKSPAIPILSDFQGAWKQPTVDIQATRVIFSFVSFRRELFSLDALLTIDCFSSRFAFPIRLHLKVARELIPFLQDASPSNPTRRLLLST